MYKFSSEVNFGIDPLIPEFDKTTKKNFLVIGPDLINDDLKLFLKDHGLKLGFVEWFYKGPYQKMRIHTDGRKLGIAGGDYIKLNYVFNAKRSLSNWYEVKPETGQKDLTVNGMNNNYYLYEEDEVNLIESREVTHGSSYLYQVGIPHGVVNLSEDRYVLSCVLLDYHDGRKRITMEEGRKIFANYIID